MKSAKSFPRSARLRKREDFRFHPYKKYQTPHFVFYYTVEGSGRIGISISKKILKRAISRNRIKRLLREVFRVRRVQLSHCDIHVVAKAAEAQSWLAMTREKVEVEFEQWMSRVIKSTPPPSVAS